MEKVLIDFHYLHIFLKTLGARVLTGRSRSLASLAMYLENTGAAVPPIGPLILLRSVILSMGGPRAVRYPFLAGDVKLLKSFDNWGPRLALNKVSLN